MIHDAIHYLERGLNVIPLAANSKCPPPGFNLKRYFRTRSTMDDLRAWFKGKKNIGIVLGRISELVAIDADSLEASRKLYRLLPKTSMMTRTAKGAHFFYRLKPDQIVEPRVGTKVLGVKVDIRGENSYVVGAPSVHPTGFCYQRVGRWELVDVPFFNSDWLDRKPTQKETRLVRVQEYARHIIAESGHGGHNNTFRLACKLRDSGLSPEQALAEMIEWNKHCAHPPWSTKELLHKVQSAFGRKGC